MNKVLQKILCWLGHDWDKYRGFEEIHPANGAICKRCGFEFKAQ